MDQPEKQQNAWRSLGITPKSHDWKPLRVEGGLSRVRWGAVIVDIAIVATAAATGEWLLLGLLIFTDGYHEPA